MTTLIQNKDVRLIAAGLAVSRATATLPASATGNIFVVSGGRILVRGLIGEVTTAVQNQACTLAIGTAPTVGTGSTSALGTATSIIAAPIGTHATANPGGATVVDLSTQAGALISVGALFVVPVGNITITTSATNTGSVKWDLLYVPLDNGAQVTAA
ncbi:hypothetical protein [Streptomyces sp. AK02-04a]|uniref:hypothetical protein n=1 Tax=Streptomyces sp. AK02-04a TaxID=3028649 RepID=UPI0029BAF37E|nr:hypothetical protein [Streptomyces sp. AK02-04a]MDX3759342.1 hypothetical protein [Streptomyces sp. AK02-04a]